MSSSNRGSLCCVVGCKNNGRDSPGTVFYSFPGFLHQKEQREKWIKAVRRINPDGSPWQPSKYSKICSRHFIGNAKSQHPQNPSFVPTIFPPEYMARQKSERSILNDQKRFERIVKRKQRTSETCTNISKSIKSELCTRESADFDLEDPLATHIDKGTQVDLLDTGEDVFTFTCNTYVEGTLLEVGTQACIPLNNEFILGS